MTTELDALAETGDRFTMPNWFTCWDGFQFSAVAHMGAYCLPRPGGFGQDAAPIDYAGPFTHLEVGFPTARPEPWNGVGRRGDSDNPASGWGSYAETPEKPTETVYGYVPVEMVKALAELHGGLVGVYSSKPEGLLALEVRRRELGA